MRIRQIGTLVFDANTNIITDATNQDAPGVGFNVNTLFDPQPFSVEIAFRRATRQAALDAVSRLARELHSSAQRRQDARFAIAGGVLVVAEDAAGGASLRSYLRDGSVTLLSVEATSTGVLARVRVTGALVAPFLDYMLTLNTLSSLGPYDRRVVSLSGLNDAYLYKHWLTCYITNMPGLYNALLAVEELESATGVSRITAINPTSVTDGIVLQSLGVNWIGTELLRAYFLTATGGRITYVVNPAALPRDVYRLFIEIFCQLPPPANARYLVSWDGQPQIVETIVGERSWYTPALFTWRETPVTVTVEIQNGPPGTAVMPIILVPVDGAFVWNVVTPPTLQFFHTLDLQSAQFRPLETRPTGTVYGAPGLITSRHIAVFNGIMNVPISGTATLEIRSSRIEPASFA